MNKISDITTQGENSDVTLQLESKGFKFHMNNIKEGIVQQKYLTLCYKEMFERYSGIEEKFIELSKNFENLSLKVKIFDEIKQNNKDLEARIDDQSKKMETFTSDYLHTTKKYIEKIENLEKKIASLNNKCSEEEKQRVAAELNREEDEKMRCNAERSRANAEKVRVKAEESRRSKENQIKEMFTEFEKIKVKIKNEDEGRTKSEEKRQASEVKRMSAEKQRKENENERLENEKERKKRSNSSNSILEEKIKHIENEIQKMLKETPKEPPHENHVAANSTKLKTIKPEISNIDLNKKNVTSKATCDKVYLKENLLDVKVCDSTDLTKLTNSKTTSCLAQTSGLAEEIKVFEDRKENNNTTDSVVTEREQAVVLLKSRNTDILEKDKKRSESKKNKKPLLFSKVNDEGNEKASSENKPCSIELATCSKNNNEVPRLKSNTEIVQHNPIKNHHIDSKTVKKPEDSQISDFESTTETTALLKNETTAIKQESEQVTQPKTISKKESKFHVEYASNNDNKPANKNETKPQNTELSNLASPSLEKDKINLLTPTAVTLVDDQLVFDGAASGDLKTIQENQLVASEAVSEITAGDPKVEENSIDPEARPVYAKKKHP